MKGEMLKELRRRVKGTAGREVCRHAVRYKDGYIICGLDGSRRKKGCPCLKYEGRLLVRLKAAIEFIIYG